EPVVSARVEIPALRVGAMTNLDGYFSISKLPAGKHDLRIVYIGMDTLKESIELKHNETRALSLVMREQAQMLETIEVVGERTGEINTSKADAAVTRIATQEIKLLPSLGTPDLAQFLQVTPGVVFAGDQGGQLFVRGGTPIMNLTRMDGAIIY